MKIILTAYQVPCPKCMALSGLSCTEQYMLNGRQHTYYLGVPHSARVWDAETATDIANILKGES